MSIRAEILAEFHREIVDLVADQLTDAERLELASVSPATIYGACKLFSESIRSKEGLVRDQVGIALRNRAIFALRDQFGLAKAEIVDLFKNYEMATWPRDRLLDKCPPAYRGQPQEQLWRAMKFRGGPIPRSTLYAVLGESSGPPFGAGLEIDDHSGPTKESR